MYIDVVPNRNSPPAVLLRKSVRVGNKVRKETLANLSELSPAQIEAMRKVLGSDTPADFGDAQRFYITRSTPHGHVQAALRMAQRLGLERLIAAKHSRQRSLVMAMILARVLFPASKLATVAQWPHNTLAAELGVQDATEDELYAALQWLQERQPAIEQRLAQRHLQDNAQVYYDLSSSYYTGRHCPLAAFGHDRDGKTGFPIIVYGLLTNNQGCPVAMQVYQGNTADPSTVNDQVQKLRTSFGLEHVTLVGDRGAITQTHIDEWKDHPELGWIGALRSSAIAKLLREKALEPSLFDRQNLAEIHSPDFPEERLVACFNLELCQERRRKREDLLVCTEKRLERIRRSVERHKAKPLTAQQIAEKVGQAKNQYKVAKHFIFDIADGHFTFQRNKQSIEQEQQLDGIYIIRTNEPADKLSPQDAVRQYKGLSRVERAFRCLKSVDLLIRPVYLREPTHVRGHFFMCMLAYYLHHHLRNAWAELLYADEGLPELRRTRDPVAKAEASPSAKLKKLTHKNTAGFGVQGFQTLLKAMAALTHNHCELRNEKGVVVAKFIKYAEPTALQRRALDLLEVCPVRGS